VSARQLMPACAVRSEALANQHMVWSALLKDEDADANTDVDPLLIDRKKQR
jgi:hypothetical protein